MSNLLLAMLQQAPFPSIALATALSPCRVSWHEKEAGDVASKHDADAPGAAACGPATIIAAAIDAPSAARNQPLIEKLHAQNVDIRRDAAIKLRMSDSNVQPSAARAHRAARQRQGRTGASGRP